MHACIIASRHLEYWLVGELDSCVYSVLPVSYLVMKI